MIRRRHLKLKVFPLNSLWIEEERSRRRQFNFYGYCHLWRQSHNVVLLSEWVRAAKNMKRPLRLWHVIEKRLFSLQKYINRLDLHIVETLKKNFIYLKSNHSTISISDKLMLKKSRYICEAPKYDTLTSTGWRHSMKWWNGGIFTTRNALLYETKVSQKWNCNEIRKRSIITRQIKI